MSDEHDQRSDDDRPRKSVRGEVKSMPGWKRTLIGISLVLALVGAGAQITGGIARRDAVKEVEAQQPTGTSGQPPTGASGFVARGETTTEQTTPEPAEAVAPPPSQLQRMAPHLTKIGGSFFAALVLGTLFRMFIKTAAMVTAAVAGIYFALTYFNVVDLDMDGIKTQYDSASGWVMAQAGNLKDVVFKALPSSTSVAAGFFVGMKR